MDLYFGGGETSDHRKRLLDAGVQNIQISYWGLHKRIKDPKNFSLAERIPTGVNILLDSGAYGASKKSAEGYDEDDWVNYVDGYMDFVELNIDRLTMVTEFDATVLKHEDIVQMREDFWNDLPGDKFMPVWHEAHGGLAELERLCEEYDRVAITPEAFEKRNITSKLNSLVQQYGVKIHGSGITKPDELRSIRFSSISSTSWVSPMRYGDTIVWDGTSLRRYPVKYKDTARRRHRMLFEKHGFDAEKIANDDPSEVVAFSIWSWLRFEEKLNQKGAERPLYVVEDSDEDTEGDEVAAIDPDEDELVDPETATEPLAISPPEVRNLPALREEGQKPLPVFGMKEVVATNEAGDVTGRQDLVQLSEASLRQCDSCHVAATCPAMVPGSTCAFSFPVRIQTVQQLQAGMSALLEMQMARAGFARFAEELEGGYPDPNVSNEIDRFFKLAEKMKAINDHRDSFKIEVEAKAGAGMLSAIFGSRDVPHAKDVIDADKADRFLGEVLDAEVIDD